MSIGNFKVKHYIKKHDVGDITKKYFKVKKGIIVPTKNLFALIRERDNFSELTIVMNSVENKYTKTCMAPAWNILWTREDNAQAGFNPTGHSQRAQDTLWSGRKSMPYLSHNFVIGVEPKNTFGQE